MIVSQYKKKYPSAELTCSETKRLQSSSRKLAREENRLNIWNKGSTCDTDERIARGAKKLSETQARQYASGERKIWSEGLTKETYERIAASAKTHSETMLKQSISGELKVWNKGLTANTDERVKRGSERSSKTLKEKYVSGEIKSPWNKGSRKIPIVD